MMELLKYISIGVHCEYISDLRTKEKRAEIVQFIHKIDYQKFPILEWKAAYQYLIGEICYQSESQKIVEELIREFEDGKGK